MERRNFVKNISMGSAAILVSADLIAKQQTQVKTELNLKGLLPFIFFEDFIRLIEKSEGIKPLFKESLKGDIKSPLTGNIARLAGSYTGNEQVFDLMQKLRETPSADTLKWYTEKLSFVLGWLVFRSATKQLNMLNEKFVEKGHSPCEIQAYQDTELIRQRFSKPGTQLTSSEFSSLFLQMLTRTITRIHTLNPDKTEGGKWLINTAAWREKNKQGFEFYGKIYEKPDRSKLDLYCHKGKLFLHSDTLIANQFNPNFIGSTNKSLYAGALTSAYITVSGFQAFMEGKADKSLLVKMV
ncbi:MAG: hypothetical protein HC830_12710 [Bacteroidetes bacterium]|nr:hypothetical protein [Bacteroidales bacterium]NJO70019.1 hypothetical protein [Bacteroidota bacterium]